MKTVNERVKEIRTSLKISQGRFAELCGVSMSTVQKIEHGTVEVSEQNLQLFERKLNINNVYLRTGKGEKFINGIVPELILKPEEDENPWANALVKEVKEENTRLQQELSRVWAIVNHLTGGKIPSFNSAATVTGAKVYYLPGKHFEASAVA